MPAFKVNEPSVASETIDGEVVVINLERGTYYSLQQVAAEVWEMISRGYDVAAIESELRVNYRVNGTDVAPALRSFLEELEREELIAPLGDNEVVNPGGNGEAPVATNGHAARVFQPPVLNTYTDMQELLLLDPIHEVDDTGWPNIKE